MISLLVSWALTLVGLMIGSDAGVLWISIVMTAIGAFGTWLWNAFRSNGKLALVLTGLPHVALWIAYKIFPEVGSKITYYAAIVLGVIAVIAYFIMDDTESSGSRSASYAGGNTETALSNMPGCIYSGVTCYGLRNSYGWGVEYVNQDDSSDVITITNIYSRGSGEMSTNAGHFTF